MRPNEERWLITHERRIDELEHRMLKAEQNQPGLWQGAGSGGGSGSTRLAYASTGGLTARSGSTLGTGNADFLVVDGGGLTSSGITSAVYSLCDEAISAGILLAVVNVNGVDVASPLECP